MTPKTKDNRPHVHADGQGITLSVPDRVPQQQTSPTLVDRLPSDLGRVARKGLAAMEAFLDLRGQEVDETTLKKAYHHAKVGCVALGAAVRVLSVENNAERISIARARLTVGE